ncbi:MAG: hypothetical protein DUD28_13190 [Lactobacillus sp.]|nr:MAG: hypothetical protein DUD28_13190 [Lactobacillus sp.]
MNSEDTDIKALIQELETCKQNNEFNKYIDEIYFPFYKNFTEFSKISFDFPLTVLVGKNGSGKSSILHALYGCPKDKTPSYFWFSTATDPIKEGNGKNKVHCFVYSYQSNGKLNQVVMKRSPRPGTSTKRKDPDYWETDKPYRKYRTQVTRRCPPLNESVIYIDFRQELSAFERFFYFGNIDDLKAPTKQDFIRQASPKLNNALNNNRIYKQGTKQQSKKYIRLDDHELHCISEILGVKYSAGKILEHDFFRIWGSSALIEKNNLSYTEAHAGSGEFAVINLVHRLISLKKDESNLILLDEPETSLYPGAQKRLLKFLLSEIKRTKSQIIMATHSEKFISQLPNSAIKSIHYDENTEKAIIRNGCSPSTVFSELEIPIKYQCNIFVEDEAAQIIIERVITQEKMTNLSVQYSPVGADKLKYTSILESCHHKRQDDFYILDGDQRTPKPDLDMFPSKDTSDPNFIDQLIKSIGTRFSFPTSRSRHTVTNDQPDPIRLKAQKDFLRFYLNHMFFLPKQTPEDIIWDEEFLTKYILNPLQLKIDLNSKTKKDIFHEIAGARMGTTTPNRDEYYALIKELTQNWVTNYPNNEVYSKIKKILENISNMYEDNHR